MNEAHEPLSIGWLKSEKADDATAVTLEQVLDERLTGNALRLLVFLRMAERMQTPPSQAEAAEMIGLGGTAFRKAKEVLRRAGYLIEVRDRYPRSYREKQWDKEEEAWVLVSRGGQNRYQWWLRNPPLDGIIPDEESLIISDVPIERPEEISDQNRSTKRETAQTTKRETGTETGLQNVTRPAKPQVKTGSQNVNRAETGLQNVNPLKEDTVGWLVGSTPDEIFQEPTIQPDRIGGAREAELDAELAALHPGLKVTFGAIQAEIAGRVDLTQLDVVQAVRDTVLKAGLNGHSIKNPAAYVARVLVQKPNQWLIGAPSPASFAPSTTRASTDDGLTEWPDMSDPQVVKRLERSACGRGEHDWGSSVWPEIERSVCVRPTCNVRRRSVDNTFAELEDEQFTQQSIGETPWAVSSTAKS